MTYDVILESVSPGFHGPVVAALLTVRIPSRTKWTEVAGFRNATTVGLGLDPAKAERLATSAPAAVATGVTAEDAEHIKAYLEAGHYPEKKEWPRPEPGRTCCVASIRPSGSRSSSARRFLAALPPLLNRVPSRSVGTAPPATPRPLADPRIARLTAANHTEG